MAAPNEMLERLLVEHLPSVRAFVRLNVDSEMRQRESCSDLVQTVCRQLLEHGEFDYRDAHSFRSWLYAAVLNKIRDRARFHAAACRAGRREVQADELMVDCYASVATPSHEAIAHERAEQIEHAFDQLPDQYREVITLSRITGLSHEDVAARLDKTEANVRMLLSRALARLTTLLG